MAGVILQKFQIEISMQMLDNKDYPDTFIINTNF